MYIDDKIVSYFSTEIILTDTPVIVKKKDELEVQLSGVILLVKKGDITKEQTDAILNITDNSFKLNSGEN